jgi:hypothetical protein
MLSLSETYPDGFAPEASGAEGTIAQLEYGPTSDPQLSNEIRRLAEGKKLE